MKRLVLFFAALMVFATDVLCEEFTEYYTHPNGREYWLSFRTIDDSTNEVALVEVSFAFDEHITDLNLPARVTHNGEELLLTELEYKCFYNCKYLESVQLPESLHKIGEYAFWLCSSLKKIAIPPSVTDLQQQAFNGCSSLEEVEFPDNALTEIKCGTFWGCQALKSISAPSVKTVDDFAFLDCTSLTTASFCNDKDIDFEIGCLAFTNCENLTEINLEPSSIVEISVGAFKNCSSLTRMVLPSFCLIGDEAFAGCSGIERFEIIDSVVHEDYYHYGYYHYYAADGVLIEEDPESGRKILKQYPAAKKGSNYTVPEDIDEIAVAFGGVLYLENITLGDNITEICFRTFRDCVSLCNVTLGGGINKIGYEAFMNCSSLKTLTGGDNINEIEEAAFCDCSSLKSVNFGNNLKKIGDKAFCNCSSLEDLTLGSNVTNIGNGAFSNCSSLKHLTLGSNVTNIGSGAFSNCSALEELTFGDKVTDFGVKAFSGCSSLRKVTLSVAMNHIPSMTFSGCEALEEVSIPDNCIFIGTSAFNNCSSLSDLRLPSSLKVMDNGAFYGCSSLESVALPAGVSELRANVFRDCGRLKTISAASGLTSIGSGALQGCAALSEVPLTDALTYIGDDAFRGCESIESLTIPNSVTEIGVNTFADCPGLKTVTVGDGVKSIGQWAFYDCTAMTDLTLGSSLEFIGAEAFDGDINIRRIECRSPEPPDFPGGFPEEVCDEAIVIVPVGCEEAYNNNPVWDPMVEGESSVVKAQYIELNAYEIELCPGESFTLVATVYPEDAADKTVTWSTDDYNIATVNDYGRVYAPERFGYYGDTVIIATCGDATARCGVTVSETGGVDSMLQDPDAEADLYDLSGVLMKARCSGEDIRSLATGVYILKSGSKVRKICI